MSQKRYLSRTSQTVLSVLAFFALLGFVERKYHKRTCEDIKITIHNTPDNQFLEEEDILRLLTRRGGQELIGTEHKNISIKALEQRVLSNVYVQSCQVSRNVKGEIFVIVEPRKPIARFIRTGKPDFYVDTTGYIMPVIDNYTARVLLITSEVPMDLPNFEKDKYEKGLLAMVNFIYANEFWRSQIAQIHINQYKQLTLYPQVGNQAIDFGNYSNFEKKFAKLKVFYEEILPLKGWNAYKKVTLKYNRQIICE